MSGEKILFLGAGSITDPGFDDIEIGGKHFRDYMDEKGIIVINPIVIESCHGCHDLMTGYSHAMQRVIEEGDMVAGVLTGGLMFGLPSMQATQTTYPIISAPLDAVAYTAFMVPSGHAVVAGVGIEAKMGDGLYFPSQRMKALCVAERILNMQSDTVTIERYENHEELEAELEKLGIRTSDDSQLVLSCCDSLEYDLLDNPPEGHVHIWNNTSMDPTDWDSIRGSSLITRVGSYTVQVRGKANLAIYAAKILGLRDEKIRANVAALGPKKRSTYAERDIYEELRGER